ncbi:hypothetical protein LMG22037_05868 [Paraburkholderia phenoliruptrix]|uniref:Uncharacterized protein n=1 Tax=Paraburkholderia phenoliruptrix TaxID=252970 RepID=A0A6J5CGA6_9BURK|nr:hypothetical protein [Paraburkholderia phenoliruptrix]CAB3734275.1 hypothetical protein LMG22037_05868 [Paraburkholderia phenoliruptrix]
MNAIDMVPVQGTFFFIPEHEQVVREAKADQAAREKTARQSAYAKSKTKVRSIPEGFDDLDMPLLRDSFAEVFEVSESEVEVPVVGVVGEDCAGEEWSDEGVKWLHALLLERSIELLSMRGNLEEKQDILDWVLKPNFMGYRDQFLSEVKEGIVDGEKAKIVEKRRMRVKLYQNEIPFTFVTCCRVAGLNPDELREQIRARKPQILSS